MASADSGYAGSRGYPAAATGVPYCPPFNTADIPNLVSAASFPASPANAARTLRVLPPDQEERWLPRSTRESDLAETKTKLAQPEGEFALRKLITDAKWNQGPDTRTDDIFAEDEDATNEDGPLTLL